MSNIYLQFAAEEAEASGLAALGLDGKAFLIQLATFVLVFLVLRKYAFGPIVNALENRRKTIEEGLKLTGELTEEKQKLEREVAEAHRKARQEANEIVSGARAQADELARQAEEKAQAKVDQMLADARGKIDEETRRARIKLEREMVDIVIRATEFVAREKIDPKKDAKLVADALETQK